MKKLRKKLTVWIALTIMMFSVVPANYGSAYGNSSITVEAATKNYMKKLGVKFDLKKNKSLTLNSLYSGIGKKPVNVKITNLKTKNAKKKCYNKLTFKVVFDSTVWVPTKKDVGKMRHSKYCQQTGDIGGGGGFTILDYNTGMCLDEKNRQNVTVKTSDWKSIDREYYTDEDGCFVYLSRGEYSVTITYPKTYKGLCIAVGGHGPLSDTLTDNDKAYMNGKKPFGKSDFYKTNKANNIHVMRLTK